MNTVTQLLPVASIAPHLINSVDEKETFVLTITDPTNTNQRHIISNDLITVGRAKDNDITLLDDAISRHHMQIKRMNGRWTVIDLNSTNGVHLDSQRIDPHINMSWTLSQQVQIGPYKFAWDEMGYESDATHLFTADSLQSPIQQATPYFDSPDPVTVSLHPEVTSLQPGDQVTVKVTVANLTSTTQTYRVRVSNLPHDWYELATTKVRLDPQERTELPLTILIPPSGSEAGMHEFQVYVDTLQAPHNSFQTSGCLEIESHHHFHMRVEQERSGGTTNLNFSIYNAGNAPDIYRLHDSVTSDDLQLTARQWQLALTPDMQDTLHLHIKPKHRPFVGDVRRVPLELEISSKSGQTRTVKEEIEIKPILSSMVLLVSLVAMVLLLVVTLIAFALSSTASTVADPMLLSEQIAYLSEHFGRI